MNKRLVYLDALRGFAMLMVVIVHVEGFSLFIEDFHITVLRRICEAIMLPLFFFVSGFNARTIDCRTLITKSAQLLIPAVIIGIAYSLYINKDINLFIHNIYKYGYWFTITLCEMLILFFLIPKFCRCGNNKNVSLIIIAFIIYLIKVPFNNIAPLIKIGNVFCLHQLFIYFHFYIIGHILSKEKDILNKILRSELCIIVSIFLFLIAIYVKHIYTDEQLAISIPLKIYRFIQDPLLGYTGIIILFRFFYSIQDTLSNTFCGKILTFIGKHTLEIYLLHYFFLPKLSNIGTYLVTCPNIILELIVVVIISACVISASLMLSMVIKTNNILGFLLLGAKSNIVLKNKK